MLLLRVVKGRPRLIVAVVCGLVAGLALDRTSTTPLVQALLSWNIGCLIFLGLAVDLFGRERDMARDAAAQEEGEWTVFSIVMAATVASFAAIIGVFSGAKDVDPALRAFHVALVAGTLLVSWLVSQTIFAMRYAHEYYSLDDSTGGIEKGLEFPGGESPDYWDFFYFALVLGMTFQVSDVQITSRKLRRLAAAHGLLGFLFNTVILALTINLIAGLVGPA